MTTIEQAATEYAEISQSLGSFPYCRTSVEYGVKKGVEFAQRWISTMDELPEDVIMVLVKDSDGIVRTGFYIAADKKWETFGMTKHKFIVTHWRPITLK